MSDEKQREESKVIAYGAAVYFVSLLILAFVLGNG